MENILKHLVVTPKGMFNVNVIAFDIALCNRQL